MMLTYAIKKDNNVEFYNKEGILFAIDSRLFSEPEFSDKQYKVPLLPAVNKNPIAIVDVVLCDSGEFYLIRGRNGSVVLYGSTPVCNTMANVDGLFESTKPIFRFRIVARDTLCSPLSFLAYDRLNGQFDLLDGALYMSMFFIAPQLSMQQYKDDAKIHPCRVVLHSDDFSDVVDCDLYISFHRARDRWFAYDPNTGDRLGVILDPGLIDLDPQKSYFINFINR